MGERPVWLIEAGVYGAEADPLLAEVRRQGMVAEGCPEAVRAYAETYAERGVPLGTLRP